MSFFGVQFPSHKLSIVFLDVSSTGLFEQVVSIVHLNAERIQGAHHFLGVGNDGIFFARKFSQEMPLDVSVDAELYFFGVDQHRQNRQSGSW